MQKYIKIPTSDWFEINGVLNWKEKSDRLIIFCHGFQCDMNKHIFYNWAQFFTEKWFHTFRFNFYGPWSKNRRLHDCDFIIHGQDIDTVVEYLKKDYEEVVLVWHSFWGLSILYSSQKAGQNILWDSSLNTTGHDLRDLEDIGSYYLDKGVYNAFVSKKMFDQYRDESKQKIHEFKVPTSVILAWESPLPKSWSECKDWLLNLKNYKIIAGANHCFDQEWKAGELFEKTLEFINK